MMCLVGVLVGGVYLVDIIASRPVIRGRVCPMERSVHSPAP